MAHGCNGFVRASNNNAAHNFSDSLWNSESGESLSDTFVVAIDNLIAFRGEPRRAEPAKIRFAGRRGVAPGA